MATTDKKNKKSAEKPLEKTEKKKTTNTTKRKKKTVIQTHDGHELTAQEERFIQEYVVLGNGRQSYLNAYPNSNPNNAQQNAYRLLTKEYITSEINHRLEMQKQESIATAAEIMDYFSRVMRGEVKDQFGLEAPLSERTKAAVELAKRQIDIPQRLAGNDQPEIKITLDWARPTSIERPKTVRELMGDDMSEEEIAKYEGNSKQSST